MTNPARKDSDHNNHTTSLNRDQLRVANQGFDRVEQHILELARLFFVTFGRPETQSWMLAFQHADKVFSPAAGPAIARSLLNVLNRMRASRPHTFNYTDPRCDDCRAFMTNEERYLMRALKSARQHKWQDMQINTLLLCEGNAPDGVMAALEELRFFLTDAPSEAAA